MAAAPLTTTTTPTTAARHVPVHEHITDALKDPAFVRLSDTVVLARFETMKVYAALGAVRSLLESGRIVPGQTLVDSSSGIYALALAMACHRYGLRCHIVASTTVDATMRAQLEVLGATVDQMPPSRSLRLDQERRVRHVRDLLRRRPDCHWMRQYHDGVHYAGYREFAELAGAALPTGPLTVVGSVGTGSSTGGLTEALRAAGRPVRLVGVQPFGSVTFGSEGFSDPDAIIAGIGSSIPFGNVRHELYDTLHWLDFRHAMAGAVELLRGHAVFAGLSTGAAHLVARWEAERDTTGATHLVLGADTGHRYTERVFARHEEAQDPRGLRPRRITALADLAPPWSVLEWAGRAAPPGARTGPEAEPPLPLSSDPSADAPVSAVPVPAATATAATTTDDSGQAALPAGSPR
ncbi:pyridoxal-phosphate dependent enzyme [Streptomyces yaizuensis]|uniref:Pyridoxal-phosphate dependent enzyme n=1 Tax=Streptomyces yaizuensis TaxID=2989713 RepID=A0ABQ5P0U4_9ACTN|nr:pyridoxal-phosphate dependent enzyme [Streptomyces sp. YSPA8]GLF95841.1 pyridoxal-phosphate dependent enzyme [Streptomyces sp. YSPA8]